MPTDTTDVPMTSAAALAVNDALVGAWMIRERLKDGPVPDVSWFSPREGETASAMMRDTGIGRTKNPDGSTTLRCFVDPTRVRSLYAWALANWADADRANRKWEEEISNA